MENFFLSKEDKIFIHFFHGNQSKVAVALQVGIIRLLGFLPEGWNSQINSDWIGFIMEQLKITINPNLLQYGNRPATRTEHLQQILKYLDYRRWQPIMDEPITEKWLLERGMEYDNVRWLLEKLCQKLHRVKILRPAISSLERIVSSFNKRLMFMWTDDVFQKLDHFSVIAI